MHIMPVIFEDFYMWKQKKAAYVTLSCAKQEVHSKVTKTAGLNSTFAVRFTRGARQRWHLCRALLVRHTAKSGLCRAPEAHGKPRVSRSDRSWDWDLSAVSCHHLINSTIRIGTLSVVSCHLINSTVRIGILSVVSCHLINSTINTSCRVSVPVQCPLALWLCQLLSGFAATSKFNNSAAYYFHVQ
jgi:hypothetical protein